MGVVHGVRVFHVEVVAVRGDVRDRDAPGKFVFLPFAFLPWLHPPLFLRLEFLDADGFGFVIALHARRIRVFVKPDFLRRLAFGEEQEIGFDAGVGSEDAVGQPDDGVQIALFQ